jgi:hypothetical protein
MQGYDFGPTERIHQLDGTAAGDRDAVPAVLFPLDFDEIAGIAEQCADVSETCVKKYRGYSPLFTRLITRQPSECTRPRRNCQG